ncbi:MAG: rod shape-determining protein MreD [Prevotella sp.]
MDILKRLVAMALLVLVHGLFLGHIHIFGIATPLIYIMLPLHFSTTQPRWSALMWCFVTGLLVDIFMNTPGMTSGALTVIGLLQPSVLRLFVQNDDDGELEPSLKTMGWIKFLLYILILTLIYSLIFFTLETFSFFNPLMWIECIGASTLVTVIIILAIERIRE